jgi:anthranilate phosphoribosyltransferase
MTFTPQLALQRTIDHREIFHDEMIALMRQIMRGEVSDSMIAAILTGLRVKKESIGEISAAATVMRELAAPVLVADRGNFVDIVGTGGDGGNSSTFDRVDVRVAGWRARGYTAIAACPRNPAAPLEALGAKIDLHPPGCRLHRTGRRRFMFAPIHHPVKAVAAVRREMGVRTIFNISPLTNPVAAPNTQRLPSRPRRHPGARLRSWAPTTHWLGQGRHGRDFARRGDPGRRTARWRGARI